MSEEIFAISNDGSVKVEWVDLGEGFCGDYDPSDPEDESLFRFDSFAMQDGSWEPLDDGSYCTQVPVETDEETLKKLAQIVAEELADSYRACGGVKKAGERMSWISTEWLSKA